MFEDGTGSALADDVGDDDDLTIRTGLTEP
jgi:hypothetical protein